MPQDLGAFLPLILLAVAFWFLIMRPQRNRQKAQAALIRSVGPGAEVMTTAGLFGTVVSNEDGVLRLAVAPGVELRMVPEAISKVMSTPEPPSDEPSADQNPSDPR